MGIHNERNSNTASTADGSNKSLVSTWLCGVGLNNPQILQNFQLAEIITAKHLASLEPSNFDALLCYTDDEAKLTNESAAM